MSVTDLYSAKSAGISVVLSALVSSKQCCIQSSPETVNAKQWIAEIVLQRVASCQTPTEKAQQLSVLLMLIYQS